MDVRLHRASKAAVLTLLIIFTTALVSIWLSNPPAPISWKIDGHVSYIDSMFNIEIPESSDISYEVNTDGSQNTTRIYVEIDTELIMNRGLLNFRTESTYITPHSWYSLADYQEASLISKSSTENWNATYYHSLPLAGLSTLGLNETVQQNRTYPVEYSLQMKWNCSLTLVEERGNDTTFNLYLDFWTQFNETQMRVDPALFDLIFIGESIVGIIVIVGFYAIDKPRVID